MKTKIIYEDKEVIVARKPAGLATQTSHIGEADMVSELKKYLAENEKKDQKQGNISKTYQKPQSPYLGIIHRLDQPVEGLLVFAKTKQTAASLTTQLAEGTLNKYYYAVVCGPLCNQEGELVNYLYKDKNNLAKVVTEQQAEEMQAKKAVLQYCILKTKALVAETFISLADVHIDTGRFHQVRVQMAYAGMPLLGDSKYGNELTAKVSRSLDVRNVALCAYRIEFIHPVTKKKLSFEILPESQIFADLL